MNTFKTIPGFENYSIDKNGNVKGLKRNKLLTSVRQDNGYFTVGIYNGRGLKQIGYVHRLVMLTHDPHPNAANLYVCHKDNDKTNNVLGNLYWGTAQDNVQQAIVDNIRNTPSGTEHYNSLFTKKSVMLIRNSKVLKNTRLASIWKCSPQTIQRIKAGTRYVNVN